MSREFDAHPAEQWTPVRHVPHGVTCDFCWYEIPAGSPGRRKGERGTRAWYNAHRRVWECLGCRSEAFRADFARLASETEPVAHART